MKKAIINLYFLFTALFTIGISLAVACIPVAIYLISGQWGWLLLLIVSTLIARVVFLSIMESEWFNNLNYRFFEFTKSL